METYTEIKQRHQEDVNVFPITFAFSEKQLKEALVKLHAVREECCTVGAGSIMKKSDRAAFNAMYKRHEVEMVSFFLDDNSLIDAIVYELANHEYGYTYDPTDTIEALSLDMTQERIQDCFNTAKIKYCETNEDN